MSGPVWRKKAPAPAGTVLAKLRAPMWHPAGKRGFILQCPQCADTNIVVYAATLETGGHEGQPTGRIVLHVNGHGDAACRHRFSCVIDFHDGGVNCFVDPQITSFAAAQLPRST